MTTIEVSRRAFIGGASAAAVVVALPVPVAALGSVPAVVEAPLKWCFCTDQEDRVFSLYFSTREEAIREGVAFHGDEPFEVGTYSVNVPTVPENLREVVTQWIGGDYLDSLRDSMIDYIVEQNDDCEFDGEFSSAVWAKGNIDEEFSHLCISIVCNAIIRHGFPMAAAEVLNGTFDADVPDQLFEALERDEQLEADLHAAVHAFMERHSLWTAGNRITLSKRETYYPKIAIEQDHGDGC